MSGKYQYIRYREIISRRGILTIMLQIPLWVDGVLLKWCGCVSSILRFWDIPGIIGERVPIVIISYYFHISIPFWPAMHTIFNCFKLSIKVVTKSSRFISTSWPIRYSQIRIALCEMSTHKLAISKRAYLFMVTVAHKWLLNPPICSFKAELRT